nr:hypothetical protein [Tanacetum cinerariifolium]
MDHKLDSWTIEEWFRSEVNSIGVDQISTMSGGPDQDHNSHVVSEEADQDQNNHVVLEGLDQDHNSHVVSRAPLSNTEEVHVQLFP